MKFLEVFFNNWNSGENITTNKIDIEWKYAKACLDRGRVLADHILVPLYLANIFSLFTLPQGDYSTWQVLRFIFASPATLVSLIIWFLSFLISTGWHERGHYIKAIRATILKSNIGLLQDLEHQKTNFYKKKHNFINKIFFSLGYNIKRGILKNVTKLRDDLVNGVINNIFKHSLKNIRYLLLNIEIVIFSPLGLCPGIIRKGLNYYIDAPFDLAVAAEGPKTSRYLGIVGLVLACALIPYGRFNFMPIIVNFGRLFLGLGVIGFLDSFFADPGKWREYRERERLASKRAEQISIESSWISEAGRIKKYLQQKRMQHVSKGELCIDVPWQFRNSGMGGRHTEKEYPESNISMQETMFIPISCKNYEDAQEMTINLQNRLKEIIENTDGCRVMGIGLEGGLAPYISKQEGDKVPEQRLWRMAKQSIKECGYIPGKDVVIALDPAASELEIAYRKEYDLGAETIGMYRFWRATEKVDMSRDELYDLYKSSIEKDEVPIISIEDGFAEDDDSGWKLLMENLGDKIFIIGDDSVTTRDSSIEYAADHGLNNTILCKANQIGTLSEIILAILVALGKGLNIVVSHRSKSPNGDMESQIALSASALGLKAGGGANTERLYKYGSIMKIVSRGIREAEEKLANLDTTIQNLELKTDDVLSKMEVTGIFAWEEATNAGIPTVGIEMSFGIKGSKKYSNFFCFKGSTPLGTSAGTGEAIHLVDKIIYRDMIPAEKHLELFTKHSDGSYRFKKNLNKKEIEGYNNTELSELYRRSLRYGGKGCLNVVDHVNKLFSNLFVGKKISDLSDLCMNDSLLLHQELKIATERGEIDPESSLSDKISIMQRKGNIGMNAILSQSLALARLMAHLNGKELYAIMHDIIINAIINIINNFEELNIIHKLKEQIISKYIDSQHVDSGGTSHLIEKLNKIFDKINDNFENKKELYKIMKEELTFENLVSGLRIIEEEKEHEIPLYEILREQLKIYKS